MLSHVNASMTYSICATDGHRHGIAIATKAPVVGSLAPNVTREGALSSQATVNVALGRIGSRLLAEGSAVDDAVETLLRRDDGAHERQVHGVDRYGRTIHVTGEDCVEWAGGVEGNGYTVAGNMLEGEHVIAAVAETFEETEGDLPERLLSALRAGEDAGGDKRAENAQSAALQVFGPDPRLEHDVRVDDHEDPVTELRRIYEIARSKGEEWAGREPPMDLQRYPERGSIDW